MSRQGLVKTTAVLLVAIVITAASLGVAVYYATRPPIEVPPPGPKPVKLVFAGRDGVYQTAMKYAIEFYKQEKPHVTVEYLGLPWAGLREKITIELKEKRGDFDIIVLDDPWAPEFMPAGLLEDLDAWFGKKGLTLDPDLIKTTVGLCRWPYPDGKLYALPVVGNVQLFAYREDLFTKYGIANPPATWRAALDAAKTIREKEPDIFGAVFRGTKGNDIVSSFLPILFAHGGQVIKDGKSAVDAPEFLEALKMFLEFKKYAPTDVSVYQAAKVRENLLGGYAAMALEVWPAWIPELNDPAKSKVVGKVRIVTHPSEKVKTAPMLGIWLIGIPATSKNKEEAFDFLTFVTSARIQKLKCLQVGDPPTRESLYKDPDILAKYAWYPAQLEALKAGVPRPRIAEWSKVEDILGGFLNEALVGIKTPEEAAKAAHAAITAALKG